MGVDTKLTLPPQTRVGDVATALGILLGNPKEQRPLYGTRLDTGWFVEVPATSIEAISTIPECVHIRLPRERDLYHFEFGNRGNRGLMRRSTPYNIALFCALADIFGGTVDFNDCDSEDADYVVEPPHEERPDDDEPWQAWQERLWAIEPLPKDAGSKFKAVAAY